jgi:tRNA dimethylallyltransferase
MRNSSGAALRAVCIMGPTAAGKTAAVMALAAKRDIDVISVDSAQVYRGMDIGTAKATAEEQAAVPHRLIDLLEPDQVYSAGAFCRDAAKAIEAATEAGRLPVLAGGTMLYFQALQKGLAELPEADPELRQQLDARAVRDGWPALHAELARLDPSAAERIRPNDAQRIQRALEVCLLSGERLSELQQQTAPPLRAEFLNIALIPAERAELHQRIRKRFNLMMQQGLLDEVSRISTLPGVTPESPSMRTVGYRQLLLHLRGELSLEEAVEKAVIATRQLAKRQMTWLRSWPELRVLDSLGSDCAPQAEKLVDQWLQNRATEVISR